jgi:hypothetical protein
MSQEKIIRPILSFFSSDSKQSYKIGFFILLILMASSIALMLTAGFPLIRSAPWDIIIQLDVAWRIIHGQKLNVDFAPFIPSLTALIDSFGMRLTGAKALSILYGNIILFIVLTPWAWKIARNRLSALNAFLFSIFIGSLLIAPRSLASISPDFTGYAMLYNRQGYVLLSMLLIELLILPRKEQRINSLKSGVTTGALMALLIFSKLTFFAVGVSALIISCLFSQKPIKWFTSLIVSFGLSIALMNICFGLNVFAYIGEMNSIAADYVSDHSGYGFFYYIVAENFGYLYTCLASLLILFLEYWRTREKNARLNEILSLLSIILITISSIFLCIFSAQDTEIPLFFVAGLIFLNYFCGRFKSIEYPLDTRGLFIYFLGIVIIIPILFGNIFFQDASSIISAFILDKPNPSKLAQSQKFNSKSMADFFIPDYQMPSTIPTRYNIGHPSLYPIKVNDGLEILRKHISKDSRIATVDFSNPFPFALELPPPEGGTSYMAPVPSSVNNNHHFQFEPEKIFKGANMVMIAKDSDNYKAVDRLIKYYDKYLEQNFTLVDSSKSWQLLTRKNS